MRNPLIACLAALLILGSCTSETPTTTSSVEDGTSVTTTIASTTSTSSVTAAPGTSDTIAWTRFDQPDTFVGGNLNGITSGAAGLVAVGTDEIPEDAAVWLSPDGIGWERIESDSFSGVEDDQGVEGMQVMEDIAGFGSQYVAVGYTEDRELARLDAATWISPDGRTWQRIDLPAPGDQAMVEVIEHNGSLFAVGRDDTGDGNRPAVWRSDDGLVWEQADSGALTAIEGSALGIASRGSRIVVVGATGDHVVRPTVWFSDDGSSWDVVLADVAGDSVVGSIATDEVESDDDMYMSSVTITPSGYVAVGGTDDPTRAVFWVSPDGLFWEITSIQTDYERPGDPVWLESVVSTRDGTAAVGVLRLDTSRFPPISFAQVWTSTDTGATWSQMGRSSGSLAVSGSSSPWHIGWMNDVIPFDGGLIAVGFVPFQDVVLPGPFYHQAVWVGTWTG